MAEVDGVGCNDGSVREGWMESGVGGRECVDEGEKGRRKVGCATALVADAPAVVD